MTTTVAFAGNLNFLNLGEVLQLLGTNGGSGVLRIISKYAADPGVVYIVKGNPINATNGSLTGIDAVYSLFGWIEGQFEFSQDNVTCAKTITKSRMEIILDGLRMLDEGKIERLGPSSVKHKSQESRAKSGDLPLIKGPLVDYSYVVDEEVFYNGDEIVREGNHGNWVWVILEGTAEILKVSTNGPLRIARIGDGAFLGSVASLLAGDNVRSATVVAVGNVQLGMLDSQQLTSELASLSADFRGLINSLDLRLRQVTDMAAEIQSNNVKINDYIKGKKPVIKQGQNEERLFRIREGEVFIARETDNGHVPLMHLQKDDYFGNIPFMDMGNEPNSANVFASPNLKLSAVDSQKLQEEHEKISSTLKNIFQHLATCISVTTLVACEFHKKIVS
ncbi:MAG: cyclic nucleotide-binding domain-containing protein [Desulfobacterales bacterium]|nr:MAG: cyclic nucleotide-binding domain-containing protein [Desulfobacterales bacterium]